MALLGGIAAGLFVLALSGSAAQAAPGGERVRPLPVRPDDAGSVRIAATKTFMLVNPFPFPVQIRILGDGPGFPQVVLMPAPPAPPVPIPYPNVQMQVQIKKPTGGWSKTFSLKWKSGTIALPFF